MEYANMKMVNFFGTKQKLSNMMFDYLEHVEEIRSNVVRLHVYYDSLMVEVGHSYTYLRTTGTVKHLPRQTSTYSVP